MRWCYTLIFNVLYAIKQRLMADNKIAKESVKREVIAGERLYTLLVYSENVAGVLNQNRSSFYAKASEYRELECECIEYRRYS